MRRPALLLVLAALASCASDDDAGERAALACVRSVAAIREVSEGTRTFASAAEVLQDNEAAARSAAEDDPRYRPIAQWIVGGQSELAAADPGTNVRRLIRECG